MVYIIPTAISIDYSDHITTYLPDPGSSWLEPTLLGIYNDSIYSPDNNTRITMQIDGNLVLYYRAHSLSNWIIKWQTNSYDNQPDEWRPAFIIQRDGNLVVYVNDGVGWATNRTNQSQHNNNIAYSFVVNNNGYAYNIQYNNNYQQTVIWSTNDTISIYPTYDHPSVCLLPDWTRNVITCVFPFIYKGISFDECTTIGIPFRYNGVLFGNGTPWCATTSNYDIDKQLGYCNCINNTYTNNINIRINSNEPHINYIRNNVIKSLVIRYLFVGDENISTFGWNYSFASTTLYFSDSSWGKLTYSFNTSLMQLQGTLNYSKTDYYRSQDMLAIDAFRLAEKNGYIWCRGICGTDQNENYFDQVIYIYQQEWGSTSAMGDWPMVWMSPDIPTAKLQWAFAMNLNLRPSWNTKKLRINGIQNTGESRIDGGGWIDITDSSHSRYKNNGQFSPCAKDWLGWLENENIITLSMNNSGIYTINAYDRPDVIPNNINGSNIFALKIEYGSQFEYYSQNKLNSIYIYYQTSIYGPLSGALIQYCVVKKLKNSLTAAETQTFGYDETLDSGQSFVVQPSIHLLEDISSIQFKHVNPLLAKTNLINVTVLSIGDGWKDCDPNTYICNVNYPNLSITVQIDFISNNMNTNIHNGLDPFNIIDKQLYCISNTTQSLQINTTENHYIIIHIRSTDEIGIYGRGNTNIIFCSVNVDIDLEAYVFDEYPYNVLNNNNDLELGSIYSHLFTNTYRECNTTIGGMNIPFIGGKFYIVLNVVNNANYDIIDINMIMDTCIITQCPINTYIAGQTETDSSLICKRCPINYYSLDIGITSINECSQCPLHRELLDINDQTWCDIEECQTLIISHDNGLGNQLDGIYYLFGHIYNGYAIYVSDTLNYVISYNSNKNKYEIINVLSDEIIANTQDLTIAKYPFLVEKYLWNENGIKHFDEFNNTKVQMIVIIQNIDDNLNIAEIGIYPKYDPTRNIAETHAKCFNLPISSKYFSWYNANKHNGFTTVLNDQDLETFTETYNFGMNMCYLNEPLEIDHIIMYPRQGFYRTYDIKIEIYNSVLFNVNNYTQTNVNNTIFDNAIVG